MEVNMASPVSENKPVNPIYQGEIEINSKEKIALSPQKKLTPIEEQREKCQGILQKFKSVTTNMQTNQIRLEREVDSGQKLILESQIKNSKNESSKLNNLLNKEVKVLQKLEINEQIRINKAKIKKLRQEEKSYDDKVSGGGNISAIMNIQGEIKELENDIKDLKQKIRKL